MVPAEISSRRDRGGILGRLLALRRSRCAAAAPVNCTWTYASDADNDRQPRNVVVDREVASLYAGKAREEALALNRDERFADAQRRLKATANRIRRYTGTDDGLKAIIAELAERHHVLGHEFGGDRQEA